MFSISKTLVSAALILFVATAHSQAATVAWNGTSKNKITFGKSYKGGGKSKIELHTGVGPQGLANNSDPNSMVTFYYHNAVNKMRCFITCKRTRTQKKMFSVFEGGELVSRVKVIVRSTRNPRGDKLVFRVKFLAEGYSWSGSGKFRVCERCGKAFQLIGPSINVSQVPVPPAIALLSTVFGLFGFGKIRKRRKKTKQAGPSSNNPPLFYTEKG